MKSEISEGLATYLATRYRNTIAWHSEKGRTLNLSYDDFILTIRRDNILGYIIKAHDRWQKKNDNSKFRIKFVLSWTSRDAMDSNIVRIDTMKWMTREESKKVGGMRKGSKHTPEALQRIAEGNKQRGLCRIGTTYSEQHCDAISQGLKGRKQSPEHAAKRSAMWAARREKKELIEQLANDLNGGRHNA